MPRRSANSSRFSRAESSSYRRVRCVRSSERRRISSRSVRGRIRAPIRHRRSARAPSRRSEAACSCPRRSVPAGRPPPRSIDRSTRTSAGAAPNSRVTLQVDRGILQGDGGRGGAHRVPLYHPGPLDRTGSRRVRGTARASRSRSPLLLEAPSGWRVSIHRTGRSAAWQRACFGSRRPAVRIRPPRPRTRRSRYSRVESRTPTDATRGVHTRRVDVLRAVRDQRPSRAAMLLPSRTPTTQTSTRS